MKILVTGGLGFIGSNFIRYLRRDASHIDITNIDNLHLGANLQNLTDIQEQEHYTFIKGDITNSQLVVPLVHEADIVVNFAAETHVDRSITDPEPFVQSNILGTYTLLEAVRRAKTPIRFIQISTDEVYGSIREGSYTENDRIEPSNPYSATKASAEMLCLAYHKTYGLSVTVTRCTNNFGPFQHPEKLIPKTIVYALTNRRIPIYGTGDQIRDWIYVDDHCDAIAHVMRRGAPGAIYNISAKNEVPNIEIVTTILTLLNKPRDLITFVEDRPGHDFRYSINAEKLVNQLGWRPRFSLTTALEQTVKWYTENQSWWQPLIKAVHDKPNRGG